MLKLIFPIVGFIGLIVFGILSIVLTCKRKKTASYCISFLFSMILVFPILITMNIIPLAYPIDIDKTSPSIVIVSPKIAADYLDINGKWQIPRVDLP